MTSILRSEEHVYDGIKNAILKGDVKPGGRLIIRNIAKALNVSPTPVMTALRMLERDGLVVSTPGMGSSVRKWSEREIIDLYEIRRHHESMACRLCAERASAADIGRIVDANERFIALSHTGELEEGLQADIDFHMAVVEGAQCIDLERIVGNLAIMQCCMRAYCTSLNIPPILSPEKSGIHQPIVDAMLARNPEAAEWAGTRHVEETLQDHLQLLRRHEAAGRTGSATTSRSETASLLASAFAESGE